MTTLTTKIVGIEEDSVLVKFVSENSAKAIDEYDAIAYQPKEMGYETKEAFIEGIKPSLLAMVTLRDTAEQSNADLSSWSDFEDTSNVVPEDIEDGITLAEPDETQQLPTQEITL